VPEEYVFILDTDMLLRRPFLPSELRVRPGHAASAACALSYPSCCCAALTLQPWPMMRIRIKSLKTSCSEDTLYSLRPPGCSSLRSA